jgi:oligopeptidase A
MATASENPLLAIGREIPFDRITAEHVEPGIMSLVERSRLAVEAVEKAPGPRTYANTMAALEDATADLDVSMTVVGHLESVANTKELREAYNKVKPEVTAFYASIPLRHELWEALKAFAATDEARALTGARKRFLQKTLDDFRRHGADLDAEGKARLEAISRELAVITNRFSQNVLDATARFELVIDDESQLAGLPESARAAAKHDAESRGKSGWRFTLQAPSLIPLLTYLDDRSIRERIYRAYNARCTSDETDNVQIIQETLSLRREKAKILGYDNFADLVLEDRMAKRAQTARDFIEDLTRRSEAAFARETADLTAFAQKRGFADPEGLEPWDVAYTSEKLRQELYDFDEEALRPYFQLEAVMSGLFETARRLYGLAIEPNPLLPTWHRDVRAYDLRDVDGTLLASFYTDFYPRDEKRGGAWMNGLVTGVATPEALKPHVALICANVTPPVADRPALLTHQEVTTLFHEFGHLLHHCLSKVEVKSLGGTNVAWDFVELPSQILENWCWEREALDTFARRFETAEPIPTVLFERMSRARTFREGSAMMRQLGFAAVDMALHLDYDERCDGDLLSYARRIMQRYAPARLPNDYGMIAAFSHLFSSSVGYAAGYYSYKWAEVLDADAFTRFRDTGVFNREVGAEFRSKVLERGDSEDPMDLYKAFMGREPSLDALLERSGLVPPRRNLARG